MTGAVLPAAIAVMLDQAADRYHVPPALLRAVAWVESRGRADALSRAGAMGVMQLMPNTAKGLGVDPWDPAENIDGGARFLARLLRKYEGDAAKVLAAYNWGPGRVDRGSTWPESVRRYIRKVQARARIEEAALAAGSSDPRLALPDTEDGEGEGFTEPPFAIVDGGPPWPVPCFSPPHCPSCTCEGERDGDDS